MFTAAGWQVITVKYGRRLTDLFARPGGEGLHTRLDAMTNPEYQRLLRCPPSAVRQRLGIGGLDDIDDDALHAAIRNLGGHDIQALNDAFAEIDETRPTAIFAYTIKGHGLPTEGHPQNHSSLLTENQMRELATVLAADLDDPWAPLPQDSVQARVCAAAAARLRRAPQAGASRRLTLPTDLGRTPTGAATTQAALGRALLDLSRSAPDTARRVVTVSPDVSSSTNLGGWVNKVGVWSPTERTDWFADDTETILHWRERPTGQHIELGIAETNLVGLIAELGSTWSRWGEPLLPIGVFYDPFVGRALEPWSFGLYGGGQAILVGTPSGVSLAPEGGAHQSVTTPSIGLEQPGCVAYEPAFAIDVEWCLLDALSRLGRPDGSSTYLRLSTRPVDQRLAELPADPAARERRRRHVLAGAYRLRRRPDAAVAIAAMGAVVTEALAAAERLDALGRPAEVICVTSPQRLFEALQSQRGQHDGPSWILDSALPALPLVTVLDGHPHTLAFLASIHRTSATHLGVTRFGQSGALDDVYRWHGIDTDSIVRAALDLVD
jgi:pyruvate dehydrogenase E1 component